MVTRNSVRWSITGLAVLLSLTFGTIAILNVEELAKDKGWDRTLLDWWPSMITVTQSTWFFIALGFFLGGAAFMWGDYFLRNAGDKIKIIYPDIPTSVRVQFQAGSQNVRQLSNTNISSTHFDRAAFGFYGEHGELLGERVIWMCVLLFKKPTTYGQVVVDAGNAQIPEYQIAAQKHDYAIIRFLGDIGNVALEIKTVPPNQ